MYRDLGEDYDKPKEVSIVSHSVRRLEKLGYSVKIEEVSLSINQLSNFLI